ncbi:MAG: hypothetical protein COW32_04650 [Candidatus Aquicultor secundus]|uniref:DUF2267 domain-containing protein n=1 Tax=Candidatus Aquicultor secundus TaxID=1973895 RepID=A0A2M7T663_9ACTN|nr:DUF2267 domain-containing protein [Candidatus Aquicultor secundus]NCO66421.1 DUF2267 domain-containing protein [Solirubrobacter sp.]OIO84454.1 MAG: hypothetical protein AUK32_08680 [Candidatus Aquicultor secundus]PIU27753.1 MAG: hypothetical protein COT10_01830 [Candidatus Aquicultor secundus]PIW22381.1 MAG: hypothetical protein COW32_04650 [Candidatus Aquicultor secundus]PIX51670.1 MAG: hypothetical protein COZ51_08320 [Candidatus Aquicultor secundus]
MTKNEFIDIIRKEAKLPEEDAKRVAHSVLLTLRSQLSPTEVNDIYETLPQDMDDLWTGGWLQRLMVRLQGLHKMNIEEFIEQVREAADIRTSQEAERLTGIVFNALKEAIPSTEVEHVQKDLPVELKDLWKAA